MQKEKEGNLLLLVLICFESCIIGRDNCYM